MFKLSILNDFIKYLKSTSVQKNLLKSLKPEDLVWAKMPLSKKQLNNIEKSHRIRPYLVVFKDSTNIFAYQSSSKPNNKLNNYEEYFINKLKYKKSRDSWINLTTLYKIPVNNLKSKYITLDKFDLSNIEKRLKILNKDIPKLTANINISEGDVININQKLYYVYSCDNVFLYCFRIVKKQLTNKEEYKKIVINSKTYYTTFKEIQNIKRTEQFNLINIAYPNEIKIHSKKKTKTL